MSRWEFMRQLEELLSDISPSEREEALQYYNDYINDAGRENDEEVLRSLGSPQQVAKIVKEGLSENAGMGEFTENGFFSGSSTRKNQLIPGESKEQAEDTHSQESSKSGTEVHSRQDNKTVNGQDSSAVNGKESSAANGQKKEPLPTWAIVLLVIGGIILSPAIIGLAASIFAAVLSVLAAALGLLLGTGIAALALLVVMIALVISGFACILTEPLVGIALIGAGLVCGSLGILFLMLTVFLAGVCIPGICKGIAYICKKLFGKKEAA